MDANLEPYSLTLKSLWKSIGRGEWIFISCIILISVAVTTFPYLYGAVTAPSGMTYTGIHNLTPGDTNAYLSLIASVKEGTNTFVNLFTSEHQSVVDVNPLWWSVGMFAKIFHLSPLASFHATRIILIGVLVVVAYLFLTLCFSSRARRKVALVVICFASGVGLFVGPFVYNEAHRINYPVDAWVPESIPFLIMYNSPHFIASLILIVICIALMYMAFVTEKFVYCIAAGVAGFLLTWFHPFDTPTVVCVVGVFLLYLMVKRKKVYRRWLLQYSLYILLIAPAALYLFFLIYKDPVMALWQQQNILLSPSIWMYLSAFALLLPFVVYALIRNDLKRSGITRLLIVWIAVSAILLYVPVNFQRRMVEGLFIPVAILAADGIVTLWERLKISAVQHGLQSLLLFGLVVFLPLTNLQIIGQDVSQYATMKDFPFYLTSGEMDTLSWIKNATDTQSIFLSSRYFGNFIPAYAIRRVYIGHGPQTIDLERKIPEVYNFYTGAWDDAARERFLKEKGIAYVVIGPREEAYGSTDLANKPFLKLVHSTSDTRVYAVIAHR